VSIEKSQSRKYELQFWQRNVHHVKIPLSSLKRISCTAGLFNTHQSVHYYFVQEAVSRFGGIFYFLKSFASLFYFNSVTLSHALHFLAFCFAYYNTQDRDLSVVNSIQIQDIKQKRNMQLETNNTL